jgi:hypothetical protein
LADDDPDRGPGPSGAAEERSAPDHRLGSLPGPGGLWTASGVAHHLREEILPIPHHNDGPIPRYVADESVAVFLRYEGQVVLACVWFES